MDTNISLQQIDVVSSDKKKKKIKTVKKIERETKRFYKKVKNLLSDYDDTWAEDIMVYSADTIMPDEIIQATKDVIENRKDKGFDSKIKRITKTLGNDALSILLTSTYYYMQDISHITEKLWEDEACDSDTFKYQTNKEPQKTLLHLKMNDPEARGVSKNGVVLPVNDNFPNALYPYAAKPDGCSAEGLQKLYNQSNDVSDDDKWLSKACDAHDRCYYTLGTTAKECNEKFIIESIDSCNNISGRDTLVYMGTKNAFCGIKALTISTGANSCAQKYFSKAQRQQKAYEQWIIRYEKAYFTEKQKKYNIESGK